MNPNIRFGKRWIKINKSIFYLPPYAVKVLRAWYEREVKYDGDAPLLETLEYLTKGLCLVNPQNEKEASYFLDLLKSADNFDDPFGDFNIKEIIDRIYAGYVRY